MTTSFRGKLAKLTLGLIAALALVLGLTLSAVPKEALADDVAGQGLSAGNAPVASKEYPLWINGAQVTSENLKGKGWSFAPAKANAPATLTLNGYSYKGAGYEGKLGKRNAHAPIFWTAKDSELVIVLKSKNTITVKAEAENESSSGLSHYYAVLSAGDLTLKGSGSLTANASGVVRSDTSVGEAGIYAGGNINIEGGAIIAKGDHFGIHCEPSISKKGKNAEKASGGIVINGGSVTAEATGSDGEAAGIKVANNGSLTVTGGSVETTGSGKGGFGVDAQGSVTIGKNIKSFVAGGTGSAFKKGTSVKNAVVGVGWTNVKGTEGKATIEANTSGQALQAYKKALFPVSASVTTPPTGKSLTYSGKPQVLITAGAADGGEMQYSLDGKTYSAKLPTATKVGDYTVYYKAIGDKRHTDSEVKTVVATIKDSSSPSKSSSSSTGDYLEPSMSNSKGSSFVSSKDEVTYTISQEVPKWATSMSTWVDLEGVLQFEVNEDEVAVTCNGDEVDSADVSIDGQRLTVTIEDTAGLRDKTVKIVYKAKLRSNANLDPYLNAAGNIASVPYQAFTSFNGEDKAVSSKEERVKFRVSSSGGTGGTSTTKSSDTSKSSLAKTGDAVAYVVSSAAVLAMLAAAVTAFAARRRTRD